jgi:hypothetical protein
MATETFFTTSTVASFEVLAGLGLDEDIMPLLLLVKLLCSPNCIARSARENFFNFPNTPTLRENS